MGCISSIHILSHNKSNWQLLAPVCILKDAIGGFLYSQTVCYNAVGCSSWAIDLATYVLSKFAWELIVNGTTVCIRLL